MRIGFVREIPRLKAATQLTALESVDCYRLWHHGKKGETLNTCLDSMREGDTLVVMHLAVLADPIGKTLPRAKLRDRIKLLGEKGIGIHETATNRECQADADFVDMVFDAINHWSKRSGTKSKGRPKIHEYSDEEWQTIDDIWMSKKYRNAEQRVGAIRARSKRFENFNAQAYGDWKRKQKKDRLDVDRRVG